MCTLTRAYIDRLEQTQCAVLRLVMGTHHLPLATGIPKKFMTKRRNDEST